MSVFRITFFILVSASGVQIVAAQSAMEDDLDEKISVAELVVRRY